MFKPTHRAMAITAAVGGSLALSAQPMAAAVIIISARATAMVPDKMEKIFGVKMQNHRTWTHWLVTCVLAGIVIGLIVYGIGYGAAELVHSRMHGHDGRHLAHIMRISAYGYGILIGVGAVIGSVMHSLADACTIGGVPLFGPFYKKKVWLMPDGLRCGVGKTQEVKDEHGKIKKVKTFEMTAGEKRWYALSYLATAAILFLHFAPVLRLKGVPA